MRLRLPRFGRRNRPSERLLPQTDKDLQLIQKVNGQKVPRLKQLLHIEKILPRGEARIFRGALFGLLIGLVWLGITFVLSGREQGPAVGGRYTEAVIGTPSVINPLYAPLNDVDADISRLVFSGLMRYSEAQVLEPDLAESYTLSPDGKTYTFTLRDGVVWHDEKPFTSRDVVFTFDMIQNTAAGSPLIVSFQGVSVTAPDEKTVVFTLPEPFAPFLGTLTAGILPEHLLFDVSADRLRLHRFNTQPIGTGPFQFSTLTKAETGFISRVALHRFSKYYLTPAFLEEIILEFFDGDDAYDRAIQALREQKVDGVSFVPTTLRSRVERKYLTIHTLQLPQYTGLFFNSRRAKILASAPLRQALTESLDKDRIIRDALKGEGEVIHGPILQGFPGFDKERGKVAYDPSAANKRLDEVFAPISREEFASTRINALLAAYDVANPGAASSTPSGSTSSSDILLATSTPRDIAKAEISTKVFSEMQPAQTFFRRDAKTKELLTLRLVTADTEEYRKAAETVAGFWQEIGVHTTIVTVPPKDIARTVLKDRDYDVLLYSVIVGSDPDQYPFWHSSQGTYPGLNLSMYSSRKADEYLVSMRTATTTETVASTSLAFQEQLSLDRPAIFLYSPTYTYATNVVLKGVTVKRIFEPSDRFSGITGWYVKTKGSW